MIVPHPFHKHSQRNQVRQDWIDDRLREARIVLADVVNHSDHLIWLACKVLVQHGETPVERENARILLVVLDARSRGRAGRHSPELEDQR